MAVVKVQKVKPEAVLPAYAHPGDAGFDLYAGETVTLAPGVRAGIPTGIALSLPKGHVGLIWDKSGLSMKQGLKTLGGVVDAGYRGEVIVGIVNLSDIPYTIERGHKVAQMLVQKVERVKIVEAKTLSATKRGKGGFGSTGK